MVSLTSDATAQTYQGGIRGAVRDANGVVPGAEVVLVNEETTLTAHNGQRMRSANTRS